ncbi:TetR/AcrR family transcriptional regulator [Nonomuraea sp. NPDC004354]
MRAPGRPRSQEVDAAILAAALDLLIECGASLTSIEQVAQRAGVTRATVYRRFADKTALLVQAIEAPVPTPRARPTSRPTSRRCSGSWATGPPPEGRAGRRRRRRWPRAHRSRRRSAAAPRRSRPA